DALWPHRCQRPDAHSTHHYGAVRNISTGIDLRFPAQKLQKSFFKGHNGGSCDPIMSEQWNSPHTRPPTGHPNNRTNRTPTQSHIIAPTNKQPDTHFTTW